MGQIFVPIKNMESPGSRREDQTSILTSVTIIDIYIYIDYNWAYYSLLFLCLNSTLRLFSLEFPEAETMMTNQDQK